MTSYSHRQRRPGRALRPIAAAAALAACLAATAPDAQAAGGTFRQILCSSPATDGAVNEIRATDGLTALGSAGDLRPDLAAAATCAASGAMDATRAIALGPKTPADVPAGGWAALRYELREPGLTLTDGWLYRAVQEAVEPDDVTIVQHGGSDPSNPRGTPYNGRDIWPARSLSSNPAGDPTHAWDSRNRVSLTVADNAFTITARCEPDTAVTTTCAGGAGDWRYLLFGAQLIVRDDADPQFSLVEGDLAEGDATEGELAFRATDVGGGVYRTLVLVGNDVVHKQVVDPESTRCRDLQPYDANDHQFAYQRPCPSTADVRLDWDTSGLGEGEHNVRVFVEDAAGNDTVVLDRRATVDRVPAPQAVSGSPPQVAGDPVRGATLVPLHGGWTGTTSFDVRWERCNTDGAECVFLPWAPPIAYTTTDDDVGKRLRIVVTARNSAGESSTLASAPTQVITHEATTPQTPAPTAPPAATTPPRLEAGPSGGDGAEGSDLAPNGERASRNARLTFAAGTRTHIRRGFAGRTRLSGRLIDEGGRPIAGATVQIGERHTAAGAPERLVAQVTTARDGSFDYIAAAGPSRTLTARYFAFAKDAAAATVARVRLVVRAELTLRIRAARPGRTTWLTGRLVHLPRRGVELQVQAMDGRRWRTFDTTRTRAGGRFRYGYRFRTVSAGRRFALRVLVASPTYPFARGASPGRWIRVPR